MAKIKHRAHILNIKSDEITFAVNYAKEDCSACAIAAICNLKNADKISLKHQNKQNFKIGDEVILSVDEKVKKKSVLLLLAVPILLVFVILFMLDFCGYNDDFCAASAITGIGIYFFVLSLCKNRFNNWIEIVRENDK